MNQDLEEALQILSSIEFTTAGVSKCPVCLGWDNKWGEQSRTHTKTCKLARLLRKYSMAREQDAQ